jgi:hypothetical protein
MTLRVSLIVLFSIGGILLLVGYWADQYHPDLLPHTFSLQTAPLAGCGKTRLLRHTLRDQLMCRVGIRIARRMRKKAVQQGRSERRGESYSCRTVSL